MPVCKIRHFTATRGTLKESLLNKERLIYILYCSCVLAKGSGNGTKTHRTALELVNDGGQYAVVYLIQAIFVYIQCLKGDIGYGKGNPARPFYLRKVTHTTQQRVGYTGRSAAAAGNLGCCIYIARYA